LWLAYSLLNWLKWIWKQYAIGGYWRKSEKKNNKPTAKSGNQLENPAENGGAAD